MRAAPYAILVSLLTLPALAQLPDLTVQAIDRDRLVGNWQMLSVRGDVVVTVHNRGVGAAVACQLTAFEDSNGTGALEPGTDRVFGTVAVAALAAGAQTRVTIAIDTGVRFRDDLIFAMVDSARVIPESNEANNVGDTGGNAALAPRLKWSWTRSNLIPASLNVVCTPLVCDLDGDGFADIVCQTTTSTGGTNQIGGELRAIDGRSGTDLWAIVDPKVVASFTPAIGDLDGDGRPEIVTALLPAPTSRLLCFEHDGTLKWASDPIENVGYGGVSIANLDGIGPPEIVVGRQALDNLGRLLWTGTGNAGSSLARLSVVADVDQDGSLDVIAGGTVYSAIGQIKVTAGWDYFVAVGNFDADPQGEIVQVNNGRAFLRNHDGSVAWNPAPSLPANGRGGPPTIADFDGDGQPEIAVAGLDRFRMFDTDGALLWEQVIRDNTSHMTASTAFDFDGDGSSDVIYRDETTLWMFRGSDGAVLWSYPMSSCTWIENAVVADLDGDGHAEIVVGANNNCNVGTQRGIFVFGDSRDAWPGARRIWNEFNYSITNVLDDGRIPATAPTNWRTPPTRPHNNFRVQAATAQPQSRFPDLTVGALVTPCQGASTVLARVGNGGSQAAPAGVPVAFWLGDPQQNGVFLGATLTPTPLAPGAMVDVGIPSTTALTGTVFVVVDPLEQLVEGREDNNKHGAPACTMVASAQPYGAGWPGTLGVPSLTTDGPPQLGASRNFVLGNSAGVPTLGALVFGTRAVSLPSGFGGTVLAELLVTLPVPLAVGQQTLGFQVPCTPRSCGSRVFLQAVQLDAGASHGLAFSRGLQVVFGR